jgi:hypothetical protein
MSRKLVKDLLSASPAAAQALSHQERDRETLALARQHLPAEVRAHCIAADIAEMRLILTLDSPAWATRVRYQAREIAAALGVSEIKVRARPKPQSGPPTRRRPRSSRIQPSQSVITNLLATAEGIEDVRLREALARLARHLAKGEPDI